MLGARSAVAARAGDGARYPGVSRARVSPPAGRVQ